MRTLRKQIQSIAQNHYVFVDRTMNMYNYEDTMPKRIGRYTYQVER